MTQNHNVSVSMNQAAAVKTGMVFKQGDFGFNLVITVLDFDVTGTTPQIVFRKPMGAVESTTITASGNTYTYAMKGTELDTPGKVFCDLKLKNSTTQRISSASFMFEVVADTLDGLAEESSSYSDTIAQIASTLQGYSEDSEAWAKGTKNGTPVSSSDAQYQNNAKYYSDLCAEATGELSSEVALLDNKVTKVNNDNQDTNTFKEETKHFDYIADHPFIKNGNGVSVSTNKSALFVVGNEGKTILKGTGTLSPTNPFTFDIANGNYNNKVVLTGEETVTLRTNSSPTHTKFYIDCLTNPLSGSMFNIVCSHLPHNGNANDAALSAETVSGSLSEGYTTTVWFSIANTKLSATTVNGVKEWLRENYLKGDPVTLWYYSSTPSSKSYALVYITDSDDNFVKTVGTVSKGGFSGNYSYSNGLYSWTSAQLKLDNTNISGVTITVRTSTAEGYTKFILQNVLPAGIKSGFTMLCNRFPVENANSSSYAGNAICGNTDPSYSKYLYVSIDDTLLSDTSSTSAKIQSFRDWVASNPIIVRYEILSFNNQATDGDVTNLILPAGDYVFKSVGLPSSAIAFNDGGNCIVEYNALPELYGKKLTVIGDSYVANNNLPMEQTWHCKLARKYGMTYVNLGVNGNRLCSSEGHTGLIDRYTSIPSDSDYIIVCIGTNDANTEVTIETFSSTFLSLCEGLLSNYGTKRILLVTPWCQYGGTNQSRFKQIIEAEVEKALLTGIPIVDNRKTGMHCGVSGFQNLYTAGIGDFSHLNDAGHNRFLNIVEPIMLAL